MNSSAQNLIEIEVANESVDGEIDAFLETVDASMVYYTPAYRRFLSKISPESQALTLIARKDHELVGLLPSMILPDGVYGGIMNSMPFFGGHGGALVADDQPQKAEIADCLFGALADTIKEKQLSSVTVVENPYFQISDHQAGLIDCEPVDDRIGQFTKLPTASDDIDADLFAMFHQKTRNAIRKGQGLGLTVEERFDLESLTWLQKVHEESIVSMGGVAKPLSVFESLVGEFELGKGSRFFVAYSDGAPVAGVLLLIHKETVEYFTPVVTPEYRDRQALSHLIMTCMRTLVGENLKIWNWGGTWRSQMGVYRFKDRWGASEQVYRYFNRVLNKDLVAQGNQTLLDKYPWYYVYKFTND